MRPTHAAALALLATSTTLAASPFLALKAAGVTPNNPNTTNAPSTAPTNASVRSAAALAAAATAATQPAQEPEPKPNDFPVLGIQPRTEIGALRFLERFPEFDGRDTVIAIFDTGVDPGAPGLQLTSTGQTKIIDVIDATGSGDVNTATIVTLNDDGKIPALSGRALTPPDWNNPTGEYRVGIKTAFELFPGQVDNRIRRDRRDAFNEINRPLLAKLHQEIQAWDKANPDPTADQLEEREDLVERHAQLKAMTDNLQDPGPIYDCIVFHDGETFRAVIDTDEDGDLTDETVLTNFRAEQQYATFDQDQLVNYALNIYDEGDTLSIVLDVNGHGTHVAGIAAAHFPGQPELDGVAPGAKIVGVKIGDTRIGTSSHGLGEIRGFIACLENNVDVVNMSYGGAAAYPNSGDTIDLYSEFVNEHGIVFVSSAGNSGPNLSTVGSPGGAAEATIGVGASVTTDMMKAQYAIRDPYPDLQFTWSSRGPNLDGALGVDITAPGGHISPMPTWTLSGKTQMNGTSMSSPSVAGSVALLISAMKQQGLDYSPQSIKRAITTSAADIPGEDRFSKGYGMIQVDAAFDQLANHEQEDDTHVRYAINVEGNRGVYIREPWDANRTHEPVVSINPTFPKDALSQDKVDFEKRIALESTADWVDVPTSLYMLQSGDSFRAYIDPRSLPIGAHFAEILGYDANDRDRGPLFRVPVTAIRAGQVPAEGAFQKNITMDPGAIKRHFVHVPEGANWADIRLKRLDDDSSRLLVIHTTQLRDKMSFAAYNNETFFRFDDQDEIVNAIPVHAGGTLELTIAQYWNSLGSGLYELEVTFEGLHANPSAITMHSAEMYAQVEVAGALRDDNVAPRARLTHHHRYINPTEATINAHTTPRDQLPEGRNIHQLILTYPLTIESSGRYRISAVPMPDIDTYMAGLIHIYDDNNHRAAMGSAWDDIALDKGDYTVKLDIRSANPDRFDPITHLPLRVTQELSAPITVRTHENAMGIVANRGQFPATDLEPTQARAVILQTPDRDDLPDAATPGDTFTGTLTIGNTANETIGAADRPGGVPLTLIVGPDVNELSSDPKPKKDELEDERTMAQKLAHETRELMLKQLRTLATADDENAKNLFFSLLTELFAQLESDDTGLRDAQIEMMTLDLHKVLIDMAASDAEAQDPSAVVDAADQLRATLNEDAIAAYFGKKHPTDTAEQREQHDLMNARRDALRHALLAVATAKLDAIDSATTAETPDNAAIQAATEDFQTAYDNLDAWANINPDDHFDLLFTKARVEGKLGHALKLASDKLSDDGPPSREAIERRIEVLEQLGWDHLAAIEHARLRDRFHANIQPF